MTTDDDGPVLARFGWCSPHDQYHNLCRKTMRSVFGVESMCDCPNHEFDTNDNED